MNNKRFTVGSVFFLLVAFGCNKKQIHDCNRAFFGQMLEVNAPDTVANQDSVWIEFRFLPKDGCGGYDRLSVEYSLDTIFVAPVTAYVACGCSLPADTLEAQDWLPLPYDSVNVFRFNSVYGSNVKLIVKS